MSKIFNRKILYLIPIFFLIIILLRVAFMYSDIKERKYAFALNEAEVLNNYALTHRTYYQQLFLNKTIPLNEKTLAALPAFSSHSISKEFSKENQLNIIIRTVSDRARNPKNRADRGELKAIKYFSNNLDKTQYFSDKESKYYQFAHALRIEKKCLECHGKRENAPLFIQKKYQNAYGYKLNEVRGIQSIKLPKEDVDSYFIKSFIYSIFYDLFLFITLFIAIFILVKKSKKLNEYLEREIYSKTKELKNLLLIDDLTKLPNRLQLLEDISESESKIMHLALLNVDSFKDINDFYGHETGDTVLKEIVKIVKTICEKSKCFLYKLPSDEFAIFTTKNITNKEFYKIIQDILNQLQDKQLETQEHSIYISLSTGISSQNSSLLATADMALKLSKKSMNNIVVYSKNIDNIKNIDDNIKGVSLIKNAIAQDRIVPFFQPIYNVRTQKIEKYEALVRIIQEDGTVLTPFHFLNIAIKSKLYPNITKIMIKKSFAFFIDKDYVFSINLSIEDIINKDTHSFILAELRRFPEPKRVVFEILEDDKIDNYKELQKFIKTIKKFGCKFAIDDFGSGYSNFAHVLELNVDYLKIDASLVKFITTDNNSRVITKTIINFASTLGLKTIAEFVEDRDSLEMLKKMGIDYIQGYYIGKPSIELNNT